MTFKNDYLATVEWLRENGCQYDGLPDAALIEGLDQIAAACMRVYEFQPGDHPLVGWFWYTSLVDQRKNGDLSGNQLDGMCFVGQDGRAAIGLSLDVFLRGNREYILSALAPHEMAHLRYDRHDDNFTSFLLELQYRYFQTKRENSKDSINEVYSFRCDTRPYTPPPETRGRIV